MADSCCGDNGEEVQFLKVKKISSDLGSPNDCDFNTPFFDKISSNDVLVIPEVGGEFDIHVCTTTRWAVGQWIYIDKVGRFQITNILSKETMRVRNGVDSDTDIPGNPEPGTQFSGVRKLWLVSNVTKSDANADLEELTASMSNEDFELCAFVKKSLSGQTANMLGGITQAGGACNCDDEETVTDKVLCFRFFENLIMKMFTLNLPKLPSISVSFHTVSEGGATVEKPVQDVVITHEGDLQKRQMPSTNAIDAYISNKKDYLLVPNDFGSKTYILAVNKVSGEPEFKSAETALDGFNTSKFLNIDLSGSLGGSFDIKALIEANLGVSLPSSGEIYVQFRGRTTAAVNLVVDGVTVVEHNSTGTSIGSKMITVDLSSPTLATTGGADLTAEFAFIPIGLLT